MQFKELRKLIDGKEALPTLLFPDDVVRIMESGEVSDLDVTSFEIQAVIRGFRDHRIWKRRDDHYDSVCWRMDGRESQCHWFPEADDLVFTERMPPSAHEHGWTPGYIVTFSHAPQGRTMADTVMQEQGIVPVRVASATEVRGEGSVHPSDIRQYKLQLDSDGSLGGAIQRATGLVTWWLLEHFEISDRNTSLSYDLRFMDIVYKMVDDSFTRRAP